jgi:hypothetical protein
MRLILSNRQREGNIDVEGDDAFDAPAVFGHFRPAMGAAIARPAAPAADLCKEAPNNVLRRVADAVKIPKSDCRAILC